VATNDKLHQFGAYQKACEEIIAILSATIRRLRPE
jgi:hypothetical protein